jgi:AcrR family transcriptional regulator
MVQAAKQLIREGGYGATAFSDVLTLSGAPRGSVYFHFPGGKAQLGMEAAEAHAHEQVEIIDRAAQPCPVRLGARRPGEPRSDRVLEDGQPYEELAPVRRPTQPWPTGRGRPDISRWRI